MRVSNRLKTVMIAAFAALGSSLFAQEAQLKTVTLDDAVNLAKENNISIKTAQGSLNLLKTKNLFSWNSISPTVKVSGSYTDSFAVSDQVKALYPDTEDVKSLSLSGSASLGLSTNLYSSIAGAKISYEAGKLSYEQTCRKIELTVRKTFYALLYEEENLKLQQQNLETAKAQYEQNLQKFKNGQISELDVMQSQVSYQSKIPTVENYALQLSNDYATFKQVLGIEQNEKIKIEGSLEDVLKLKKIQLPENCGTAPDIKSAEYDLQSAKNNLLAARFSAYGPVVSASYSFGTGKTDPGADEWKVSTNAVTVGVSIPLDGYLPWSTGSANIAANKVSLKNAQMNLDNTKTTVEINTENYLRKINQGIAQLDSLKATADLSKQSYKMTQTAYNYGKTDLMNLQSASNTVLSSEVNVKSQAYSLISTILDLEYLLGIPFGSLCK